MAKQPDATNQGRQPNVPDQPHNPAQRHVPQPPSPPTHQEDDPRAVKEANDLKEEAARKAQSDKRDAERGTFHTADPLVPKPNPFAGAHDQDQTRSRARDGGQGKADGLNKLDHHRFEVGDRVRVGNHVCKVQGVKTNPPKEGSHEPGPVTSLSLMTEDGKHSFDALPASCTLVQAAKDGGTIDLPPGHPFKDAAPDAEEERRRAKEASIQRDKDLVAAKRRRTHG